MNDTAPSLGRDARVPPLGAQTPLLELSALCTTFGQVMAINRVSLNVREGEIVALLGPNGAGKTTLLRTICGLVRASGGAVHIAGRPARGLAAPKIARLGVGLVPEGRKVFPDQTVAENLLLGGYIWRRQHAARDATLESVYELFPRLKDRRNQAAGTLSGGEAQMLAVARALMLRPRLLMLDEPSLGLAPKVIDEMFGYLERLHREEGLTILLVEQAAARALAFADRSYLLTGGRVVAEGDAGYMRDHPEVQRVYFGDAGE